MNLTTEKVWDIADVDRALAAKLKKHSGNVKKCEILREGHEVLCEYIKFNIDYMDEHLKKMEKNEASEAWLEEYAEFKIREKENEIKSSEPDNNNVNNNEDDVINKEGDVINKKGKIGNKKVNNESKEDKDEKEEQKDEKETKKDKKEEKKDKKDAERA